ncbi:putative DNA helicase [Chlorella vulgaris]
MAMNRLQTRRTDLAGPPQAWGLYFGDAYATDDRRAILVAELVQHFASPAGWQQLLAAEAWHARCLLPLDWQKLVEQSRIRDLPEAMLHAAAEALGCIACAAYEVLFRVREAATRQQLPDLQQPCKVLVRLSNHPGAFKTISSIKADSIGRLVTVRGTIVRSTPAQPLVVEMDFVCGKCGAAQRVPFPDGRFAPPPSCGDNGCRSRTLVPVQSTAACVDWQRVSLQGLPKDERNSLGRVPVPIGVELSEDLVGRCTPGSVATVVGLVKVQNGDAAVGGGGKGGDMKAQCLFLPYIDAVSVSVMGSSRGSQTGGGSEQEQAQCSAAAGAGGCGGEEGGGDGDSFLPPNMPGFSHLDLKFICEFTNGYEGDQLRLLVHSLCPSIFGHELVKAGLLLSLFGGGRKASSSQADMALRRDIHVLLVGDPGLGKSQLLQAAAAAAPRGVYICGNTSSAAGLTASVVREGGEFAFDAGALVVADRGVCCIDEFDKMRSEHQSLLGAMEQQEVSVAKAGMVASLPARTTVLAAANPAEGSYNRGRTLLENLKISPAMLSRFDLVFLLLDRPDGDRDQRLADHVMALHSGLTARAAAARNRLLEGPGGSSAPPLLLTYGRHGGAGGNGGGGAACGGGRVPLLERLKERREGDEPLPTQLLRKYIAYARQYVHPRLSEQAMSVLKEYYLQLRIQSAADPGSLPVTARQLESLVRLCEARARLELREEVTAGDAEDVVELMRQTLDAQVASGGTALGCIDFTRGGGGGRPGSQAGERRRYLEALARHCQAKGDAVVEAWEMQDVADRIVLQVPSLHTFIAQLNEAGK